MSYLNGVHLEFFFLLWYYIHLDSLLAFTVSELAIDLSLRVDSQRQRECTAVAGTLKIRQRQYRCGIKD